MLNAEEFSETFHIQAEIDPMKRLSQRLKSNKIKRLDISLSAFIEMNYGWISESTKK